MNVGNDVFADFITEYNDLTSLSLSGKEFLKCVFETLEFNFELIEMIRELSDIVIVSDNYRENIEYITQKY